MPLPFVLRRCCIHGNTEYAVVSRLFSVPCGKRLRKVKVFYIMLFIPSYFAIYQQEKERSI